MAHTQCVYRQTGNAGTFNSGASATCRTMVQSSRPLILLLSLMTVGLPVVCSNDLAPVFVTPVDMNVTWQATFNSFKQQLVENGNGIFMVYCWKMEPPSWRGYWNLLRSQDGGETFDLVYTSPLRGATVPCIETDERDNIHLVSSYLMGDKQPFYYYRFLAEDGYRNPSITEHDGDCASEKYSVFLDRNSHRLYLFNNQGVVITFDTLTGKRVARSMYAYSGGAKAFIQYPHVFVENGTIYHAWTTQRWTGGASYVYYDIHFAKSPDGGTTWQKADGTVLNIPFVPDDTGPTDHIVEKTDLDYHTWLNSLTVKDGKAHLCYFSDRDSRHYVYVRIDLGSGEIDRRMEPRGETITLNGNGGFFSTNPGRPIYLVSTNGTNILALVSEDNGDPWHDLAVGPRMPGFIKYLGACREVTSQGIIGSFTLFHEGNRSAYYFRIPLGGEQVPRPGLRFSLKPSRIGMLQGESKSTRVTIVADNSFEDEMVLDAVAPAGIEVDFFPEAGKPNFSSTIRLKVGEETPPGTYNIPVTASGTRRELGFTLEIEVARRPPSPDFDIAVDLLQISLGPGESSSVGVKITPLNGFSDYWSLKLAGLPPNIQASFDPSWGREPYASNLTISARDSAPAGGYVLNITGSGGGRKHSCALKLTVVVREPEMLFGIVSLIGILGGVVHKREPESRLRTLRGS